MLETFPPVPPVPPAYNSHMFFHRAFNTGLHIHRRSSRRSVRSPRRSVDRAPHSNNTAAAVPHTTHTEARNTAGAQPLVVVARNFFGGPRPWSHSFVDRTVARVIDLVAMTYSVPLPGGQEL